MLESAIAQLRVGMSIAFGLDLHVQSFERLVAVMRRTHEEFGVIGPEASEVLNGPLLDESTLRIMQTKRFRKQAVIAANKTEYYADVFERLDIDPATLREEDVSRLPITPKSALRDHLGSFVRHGAEPGVLAMTTGTSGYPTRVWFSNNEMRLIVAITSSHLLLHRWIEPEDVVQISISARATLAVTSVLGACANIGAAGYVAGMVDPDLALALLTERRPTRRPSDRTTVIDVYPSYLGELVESGLRRGLRPSDFGLRRVIVGGEIVTRGLITRARRLFGEVEFIENYAATELVPMGGTQCAQGHWHFEPSAGMVEVSRLDGGAPASANEPGTLIATPFYPYRTDTVLLRYDSEDVAMPVARPTCELAGFPATTELLGRRSLCARHDQGWTFPRQVLEALEAVDVVPLPARCGFVAAGDGVDVDVVAGSTDALARRQIGDSLEAHGVPVRALRVVTSRAELRHPLPLRADLREQGFLPRTAGTPTTTAVHADEVSVHA